MIRAAVLAAATLAVVTALFFARPHATPGPPMRDFEAYYAAGQTWNAGGDPYSLQIWNSERALEGVDAKTYAPLPFISPPATLPLWSALARLPFPAANVIWRFALILSALALALVAIRLLELPLLAALLPVAIAALGFGPLTSAIALGQIALPACAFAALALIWRPFGIFAWIQPNIALSLVSQSMRAAVFGAACVALAGAPMLLRYAALLREHGNAERFSAIQLTPAAIAYDFGAPAPTAIALGIVVALAAIAVWFAFLRRIEDVGARFCATCALLPVAVPFFHEHDLTIVFLPAVYVAVRCSRRLWPLACGAALFCATDWLGLAQRPDGTVQTLLLIGAAGCALAALRRDFDARMLLAPLAVLIAIGFAATLAHAHTAPVWPDAMHAITASGDTASTWHAEQVATGLFRRDPVWAALRLFSLLGCTLLVYCGVVVLRQPQHDKGTSDRAVAVSDGQLPCHAEPVEA